MPAPARAQQEASPAPAAPHQQSTFDKVAQVLKGPVHPIVRGVMAGGGLGAGLRYDVPTAGRWEAAFQSVVTIRRYWSAEAEAAYRAPRGRIGAYARVREMSQLSYFGQGAASDLADRTTFLLRDPVIGAVASAHLTNWMSVGGRAEEVWPEVDRGLSPLHPSLDDRFGEAQAPGLRAQPRFGRYQAFLAFETPAGVGQQLNQGGRYRIGYGRYVDQQFDRFTFTRIDVEARHRLALLGPHRRLTLHGWLATTDAASSQTVPFYLQPSLGGTGQLGSVGEQLIGTDGTRGTLRGFDNFRFRDRHLLLLQADYRVPVWGPFDASVFVDAGKVTARRSDLDLSALKHDYGFSVSLMRGPTPVARTEFAFGSGEGAKVSVLFALRHAEFD